LKELEKTSTLLNIEDTYVNIEKALIVKYKFHYWS